MRAGRAPTEAAEIGLSLPYSRAWAFDPASYGIFEGRLRFGAEVKVGLDQHGGPTFQPALLAGPNALVRFGPFKLTGTFFVGFLENDPRIEPYLIAGLGF